MAKFYKVHVTGHITIEADSQEEAMQVATAKLMNSNRWLGAPAGFIAKSATEVQVSTESPAA
jgi:hypothetical protein